MDNRRACRVAVYTKAHILTDSDSSTLLECAAKKATRFYQAFGPESRLIMFGAFEGGKMKSSKRQEKHPIQNCGPLIGTPLRSV
jgi:hypothetical protein